MNAKQTLSGFRPRRCLFFSAKTTPQAYCRPAVFGMSGFRCQAPPPPCSSGCFGLDSASSPLFPESAMVDSFLTPHPSQTQCTGIFSKDSRACFYDVIFFYIFRVISRCIFAFRTGNNIGGWIYDMIGKLKKEQWLYKDLSLYLLILF